MTTNKLRGLPPVEGEPPKKKKSKKVKGLPKPDSKARVELSAYEKTRFCQKCGLEGRVVSNHNGVNVFCQCGYRWPISSTPMAAALPHMPMRGMQKITSVEPNWELAFTDIGEGNDKIGPKPKG